MNHLNHKKHWIDKENEAMITSDMEQDFKNALMEMEFNTDVEKILG